MDIQTENVPGLCASQCITTFHPFTNPRGLGLLYSNFIGKDVEAEGGEVTCSRPHRLGVVKLEFSLQRKIEKKGNYEGK